MDERTDILFDEDGDIRIGPNLFVVGRSESQEIRTILMANPGDFKNAPALGVGLTQLVKGNHNDVAIVRKARIHLKMDGYPSNFLDKNLRTVIE